jgi:uncharacterized protein with von Willebrand factor type A (vWA) domain
LQQAMRRLMQKGIKNGEKQTKGIEDLLAQVAREMRKLYDEYRLQSAMEEMQENLDSVVEQEQETLQQMDESGQDTQEKKQFLNDLPGKTSEAIEKLTSYRFENANAEKDFQKLLMQLEQIRKLEKLAAPRGQFVPRPDAGGFRTIARADGAHGRAAQTGKPAFQHAVERRRQRTVGKTLGGEPKQDFEGIMRMQSLLEEGGYVLEQGERFELTPKGVRRVGQLALRDIYRQLRRDGMGRHATNRHGSQELVLETSRPHVQGEPLHINMIQTLKNALLHGGGVPVRIGPKDFAVYETEHNTRAATVLLLDMSWSMSWEGRFAAAKKVALAMESLVRCAAPARLFRHRRFLHPRRRAQSQRLAAGDLEHGRSLHQLARRLAPRFDHA